MKKINELIPFSDAQKQLDKRKKETSMQEDVKSIKNLAEGIYENLSKKYSKPIWFEIRKDDYVQDTNMWQSHLDYLDIESDSNVITLKVVAYVEHENEHDAPCY